MIFREIGKNHDACLANIALKAVVYELEEATSSITSIRTGIHASIRECSDDYELLIEIIDDYRSNLKGREKQLLNIKSDIIEIMEFLESKYFEE